MAENKVLLTVSKSMPTQGARGEWSELKQANDYIVGIDSGEYDESAVYSSDELAKDVTGFPSAWARSNFIKLALSRYNMSPMGLLDGIYRNLREEWQGLITLIATEASKISVEVLPLSSDDDSSFSLAALLGDVLFLDNKDSLWYDKEIFEGKVPFIQLIKYEGNVIGASSPETLVFPAVKYNCADVKWFDKDKRRFVAPQLSDLTERQLKDLYLVLSKIEKGIDTDALVEARDTLREFIRDWIRDVEKEAKKHGYEVSKTGVLGSKLPFVGKLGIALACDDKIYEYDGRYYFEPRPGAVAVDLGSYLLPNNSTICELKYGLNSHKKVPEKDLDVYVLMPADDGNGRHFFPLPLTETGLLKWCDAKEKVENLLKPFDRDDKDAASRPHLEAILVGITLQVTLSVLVQNDVKEFKRQYLVKRDNKKFNDSSCILWPNFVSPLWRDYYMYTECLEDVISGIVTKPIYYYFPNEDDERHSFVVAENEDGKSKLVVGLVDSEYKNVNFKLESDWTQDKNFKVEKIVKDRGNSSAKHHYDVWRSNKPIAGVALSVKDSMSAEEQLCGYLLFKKVETIRKFDMTDDEHQVVMGMDFGSNNSCVYFKKMRGSAEAEPLKFRNMRVFALGEDQKDIHKDNAKLDELLFFQNEPKDGQFKSWVAMPDRALEIPEKYRNLVQTVCGGMCIFEPNLNVLSIDSNRGVMDVEKLGDLYYNMKWRATRNDEFAEARRAFVDSIWRQAAANLFLQYKMVPAEFKWSYPGAFTQKLAINLGVLYEKVIFENESPFCKANGFEVKVATPKHAMTEAASVLSSIGSSVRVDSGNIVVAMDIGGSTTDLLVWYLDKDQKDKVIQSSVCMAAGSVTAMFENSDNLRKAMISFQKSHPEEVPMATVGDFQTHKDLSYYYVNTIFDIVAENSNASWARGLYEEFAKGANKSIEAFALPAYIAGFLTFYAGMLLHHILEENHITTLDRVTIHPVGKGSRILDWLKTRSLGGVDTCDEFLQKCLRAGLRNPNFDKVHLDFKSENDPKSVVAKGLVMQKSSSDASVDQIILFGEQGILNKETDSEVSMELNLQENFAKAYSSRLRLESNADIPFPVFKSFCDVFLKYLKDNEIVESGVIKSLRASLDDMRPNTLNAWVSRQPTFVDAQDDGDKEFEYKESYLVLEALYFLEKHLIPIVTARN